MIKVSIFRNTNNEVEHFKVVNHGEPIVCAGVSSLVITCVNFLEEKLGQNIKLKSESEGYIECNVINPSKEAFLILEHLVYGLSLIEDEYPSEITIRDYE